MSDHPRGLSGFAAELKRRHVFRTLLAYGAVTFVVLQAAEIVLPAFGVGDWVLQLVVVLGVLGLPVVLALAWVYEITPRGIRTTKELDLEAGRRLEEEASMLPRLGLLAVTLLAAGAAGVYWVRASVPSARAGATDPVAGAASPAFRAADQGAVDVPVRSLAVLPLESFASPSAGEAAAAEGDYFAAGMHEALVSRLSRAGASFRVISRTTVQQYDPSGKSMAQIGSELGVEGIVEGSVTLDGNRVRITVQLIHAPSDRHLWSADYERELEDVIALQREVATAIAGAIMGELGEGEANPLRLAGNGAPEADPEAALAEMKGRVALGGSSDPGDEEVVAAQRHFEAAVAEDSAFVPALVGLAGSTLMRELLAGSPSAATLERVGAQVDRALRLDPESPEARDLEIVVKELQDLGHGASVSDPGNVRAPDPPAPAVVTDLGARLRALGVRRREVPGRTVDVAALKVDAARSLVSVGRLEDARRLLLGVVENDPEHAPAWNALERVLVMTGRADEVPELRAERAAASGDAATTPGGPSTDALAEAVRNQGTAGYWRWRLEEIGVRRAAGLDVSPVDEATAHAALGRPDAAFDALAGATAEEDPDIVMLRADPTWDPYRRDPRFAAAVGHSFDRHGSRSRSGAPPG